MILGCNPRVDFFFWRRDSLGNLNIRLHWMNESEFKISHPERDIWVNFDLKPTIEEKAPVFRIVNPTIRGNVLSGFVQFPSGKFLQSDERWFGHQLKNDSDGNGAWEAFTFTRN